MPWGTKFSDLEELAVQIGQAVSQSMTTQALAGQARAVPAEAQTCGVCGTAVKSGPPPEPRTVTTTVGTVHWNEPKRYCPQCRAAFFPSVPESGSWRAPIVPCPAQIVYAGVQNTSFAVGRDDLLNLARLKISEKQVERVTERLGQERVEQHGAQVQAFLKLPVMEKFAAAVAHPPDLAVVEMDGGRLQIRNEKQSEPTITGVASPVEEVGLAVEATPGPAVAEPAVAVEATPGPAVAGPSASETRKHWREDKIGLLMTMTSEESAGDTCPTIPETFVNPLRIIKLTRELHGLRPGGDAVADPSDPEEDNPLECPEYISPTVLVKSMVATRQDAESLGKPWLRRPGRGGSMGRNAKRSWPMEPNATGRFRSSGSAILCRLSISSTYYRMCSPRRRPGGRSGRAGRCMCGGLAWCGRGA